MRRGGGKPGRSRPRPGAGRGGEGGNRRERPWGEGTAVRRCSVLWHRSVLWHCSVLRHSWSLRHCCTPCYDTTHTLAPSCIFYCITCFIRSQAKNFQQSCPLVGISVHHTARFRVHGCSGASGRHQSASAGFYLRTERQWEKAFTSVKKK